MEELKLMCPTMPSIADLPPKMQQMLKLPKKVTKHPRFSLR
jgi:hypothetical protein